MRYCKIAVLGTSAKSTFTIQFVQRQLVTDYDPTIEDSYKRTLMVDNENFQLDILDTAGQDAFRSMYVSSMRQSMGFIIVYAIEDRVSFEEVEVLHLDLMGIKGTAEIPVVICGNKCDLAENNRVVSKEEGEELASKLSAIFFETSVLANINVENAFAALVKRCEVF